MRWVDAPYAELWSQNSLYSTPLDSRVSEPRHRQYLNPMAIWTFSRIWSLFNTRSRRFQHRQAHRDNGIFPRKSKPDFHSLVESDRLVGPEASNASREQIQSAARAVRRATRMVTASAQDAVPRVHHALVVRLQPCLLCLLVISKLPVRPCLHQPLALQHPSVSQVKWRYNAVS
jgi:hypothetical protein